MSEHDDVNHPQHYVSHPSGVECITITESMGFCVGNAVKHLWRADLKGDAIQDLEKARWYIDREIARRKAELEKRTMTIDSSKLAAGTSVSFTMTGPLDEKVMTTLFGQAPPYPNLPRGYSRVGYTEDGVAEKGPEMVWPKPPAKPEPPKAPETLWDSDGDKWTRRSDGRWSCPAGSVPLAWSEMLEDYGPMSETPPDGDKDEDACGD